MTILVTDVDLTERLSKLLDIMGLTTIHDKITEVLHTIGIGREAADVATWTILIFIGLAIIGYLGSPPDQPTKTP